LEVRPVFLVLLDISGYTRFATAHKGNILHAELIIGDLLESIIRKSRYPLVVHELLGDAVTLYVQSEPLPEVAKEIRLQVAGIFEAFRQREGVLISDCRLCSCEACRSVGMLRLKAILHFGQAVFTAVQGFSKIAGPDVILAHRLLKNSIPSHEYMLETEPFYAIAGPFPDGPVELRKERYEDLGTLEIRVRFPSSEEAKLVAPKRPLLSAVWMNLRGAIYILATTFGKPRKQYRNLEAQNESVRSA